LCKKCGLYQDLDEGRIPPELFEKYLTFFLQDNPFEECPKGGHAAYGQGVTTNISDPKKGHSKASASYFMTYHTILKTSKDYTDAMKQARTIADNITRTINSGK